MFANRGRSTLRSLGLAALVAVVGLGAGACTSPLDEPLGSGQSALRVSEQDLADLPSCPEIRPKLDDIDVLVSDVPGVLVVATGDSLLCWDDAASLGKLGVPATEIPEDSSLDGTPLPARVSTTSQAPGTPLPAKP